MVRLFTFGALSALLFATVQGVDLNRYVTVGRDQKCGVTRGNPAEGTFLTIHLNCGSNLECKNGYCAFKSYLSPGTVSCKNALAKNGYKGYVAISKNYCYVDNECKDLYYAAEGERYEDADKICNDCGKYCVKF
ncbi:hypothetical protein CU098_010654 [Rhizopus stolonifer]|uniref:Secreted protein n=1 Tax=Rhizopus stolonifer TaxID=4846 RepID=A0A367KTG4_RHIST|nr:hypothetical protein CU098_010654 [Rhizopus stolonifer]